jgi:hypothetical protein
MRDRHIARLCRSCRAPMARQEGTCWGCGTRWASEEAPRSTLTVIAGGLDVQDADRWANEGGSIDSAAAGVGVP